MPAMADSSNKLLFGILLGVCAGALLGGLFPEAGRAVKFIGELFMRALLLLAVPLVATSMIAGVSGLGDVRKLGGLGAWTITYFLGTTLIAVVLGIFLSLTFRPGDVDTEHLSAGAPRVEQTAKVSPPEADSRSTNDTAEKSNVKEKTPGQFLIEVTHQLIPKNIFESLAKGEVVPVIVFALVFGCVLTTLGAEAQVVIAFFHGLNEAIMKMVHLLMWTAPVGIGALIAARLGDAGGFGGFQQEMVQLGMYVLTVLTGLAIHGAIILPVIFLLWCRRFFNLLEFARGMLPALATAFSTASSSASLPVALDCVIENNKVSEKVASFVMPLGTINQNGTALYEAVAVLFIAQLYGVHLGPLELLSVVVTATLAAIGAAGIPEAGLVTMVIVLNAVHLPLEGISLLLVVDWFLDRCRTAVNVWTDSIGAAIMDVLERKGAQTAPSDNIALSPGATGARHA